MRLKLLPAFLLLLTCAGCAIFGSGNHLPPVRQVADQLDNVPPGTAIADIPCLSSNYPSSPKRITPFDVLSFLIVDPTRKKNCTYLYRLKPADIVLSLTEDDYYVYLPVEENESIDSFNGQVTAFFDASNHYLGYYAWSDWKASEDSDQRFSRELCNFTNTGMAKACNLEKTTRDMRTEEMKRLIRLPLSQHLAQ